jgi:hypothetical protein
MEEMSGEVAPAEKWIVDDMQTHACSSSICCWKGKAGCTQEAGG